MIYVLATIELKAGHRDDFLAAIRQVVPTVCEEDGCLEYRPAMDVSAELDREPPNREDVVTVIEKWQSIQALKAHLTAPHMLQYRERVKEFVMNVQIRVLQPVA